jgi:hypothetical protein
MTDKPLFEGQDALERIYAPDQLPAEEQGRVRADEGVTHIPDQEPPPAAPVASVGTESSAPMAPPEPPLKDGGIGQG